MILVTGATGHFGSATIQFLLKSGLEANQITALVRHEQAANEFEKIGVATAIGDYDNYASLLNAFKNVDKLLFVSASDIGKRLLQHQNVVKAAVEAGVKHIVYTSFQRKNETEASPLWMVAQAHLQTEKWIKESGMSYTILKNNLYMDFVPAFLGEKVLETGVIYVPAQKGSLSAVLRSEMAEAAAAVLIGKGHEGKVYDFVNTKAITYDDIANTISEIAHKQINYISPTVAEYTDTLTKYQVPQEVIGIFTAFAVAQSQGELDVTGSDLKNLIGRNPLSVKDFIKQLYSEKH
ncbi:MAG: SDR family oxidoreductase [Bacteroidia bacterium]|nr:SDR family oxidoreductase [Bacteroidia bacterium]